MLGARSSSHPLMAWLNDPQNRLIEITALHANGNNAKTLQGRITPAYRAFAYCSVSMVRLGLAAEAVCAPPLLPCALDQHRIAVAEKAVAPGHRVRICALD